MEITPIATFHSPFKEKFGIPRQSGLVGDLEGTIEFMPEFQNPDFVRGIEDFDYIWIIWEFSANRHEATSPTVRPPRLGGNERMGVYATRSPYRRNRLGLSAVKLERVDVDSSKGPILHVRGADLMEGTPIYDIKPYVAYADSFPEARSGFAAAAPEATLEVRWPTDLEIDPEEREALEGLLALDPRPAYQEDPERVYGMPFGGKDVHFQVKGNILTVIDYA